MNFPSRSEKGALERTFRPQITLPRRKYASPQHRKSTPLRDFLIFFLKVFQSLIRIECS